MQQGRARISGDLKQSLWHGLHLCIRLILGYIPGEALAIRETRYD